MAKFPKEPMYGFDEWGRPKSTPSKPAFGFGENGKPVHALNKDGVPICGARRRGPGGGFCQQALLSTNGRCPHPGHGGASKRIEAIKNRNDLIAALGGKDSVKIHELVKKLHEIAIAGNLAAITYIIDQIFGTAKTTIVQEIGNRELLAHMVRVTARFLKGPEFDEWLSLIETALASDSTSSEALPEG